MEMVKKTLAEAGCIGVDTKQFGHGMSTLFTGMAEVFSSLGAEVPEYKVLTKPEAPAATNAGANTGTNTGTGTKEKSKPKAKADGESKGEGKTETPETPPVVNESTPDTPVAEVATSPTTTPAADATPTAATPSTAATHTDITRDDITEVIVAKLKAKRENNEAIQKLLAAHGVAKVSELQASQFEAFMSELAQI